MPAVTTHYKGDMLFETVIGNHRLTVDVAPTMGGKDRGPTSPDLFVASLGACVAAFVASYCGRAQLDARGLTVEVSYRQRTAPLRLDNLAVRVELPRVDVHMHSGALLGAAEHCPIGETIETIDSITFEFHGAGGTEG